MFTGIVEELGRIAAISRGEGMQRMAVAAEHVPVGLPVGASVAVNGVCLTAVEIDAGSFSVDVVTETLGCTNLGELTEGSPVNLERPMRADGRFEGHIVQGHVDGVGEVIDVSPEGDGKRIRVALPTPLARYVVHKGSVTVDGVSLTVAALDEAAFEVALIPHTLAVTVLGFRRPGDRVNLEVDVLAKYMERLMEQTS